MESFSFPDILPAIPTSIQKIESFFADEPDLDELIDFLQVDPMLSLHILHLVNSPFYGIKNSVTSIRQAVMLLGTTMIRGMILASVIKKTFPVDLSVYKLSIEQFEMIPLLRIRFAKELCKYVDADINDLSAKIFLMEDGKLLTSYVMKEKELISQFHEMLASKSVTESELALLGVSSYEAMGILLEQWKFNKAFTKIFFNILNPQTKEEEILNLLSIVISVEGVFEEDIVDRIEEQNLLERETLKQIIETFRKELEI